MQPMLDKLWQYIERPLTQTGMAMVLAIIGTIVPSKIAMIVAGCIFLFAAYREGWFDNQKWYMGITRILISSAVITLVLTVVWFAAWKFRDRPPVQPPVRTVAAIEPTLPIQTQSTAPAASTGPARSHNGNSKSRKTKGPTQDHAPISTGLISQGAGSVLQIGGSANSATVTNNFGPRSLVLSPEQQDYVASHLGNFVGNGVDIDVDGATPMTSDFADALRASLKKAGIGAKRNDAMFIGPCLKYPGVSFMVGVNRFSEAEAIWGALLGARAVEGKGQACNRSGEPDELHIYVRPPG